MPFVKLDAGILTSDEKPLLPEVHVACGSHGSSRGDITDAMRTLQQTELAATNPQRLGDEYRAPIPGSTEEKVYRQYYIPFCVRVGVKPAPFLRWLVLSQIVDKSRVEILEWRAPARSDGNLAQPSWISEHAVERFIQTNTVSTVTPGEENTALPVVPKDNENNDAVCRSAGDQPSWRGE
jgi:hypothetical protein